MAFCVKQMASLEGWSDVMYAAQDVRGPGLQPTRGHNPAIAIYFILFIVFGAFLLLQLVIGVSVDKVRSRSLHNWGPSNN